MTPSPRAPALPPPRATGRTAPAAALARLQHRPRKALGQHFLVDPAIADRIVALAGLSPGRDAVLEIGPGLGALTGRLAELAGQLWLVEVDPELVAHLRALHGSRPHVHLVEADVLELDLDGLLGPQRDVVVVANLPYNIATAVVMALLARPGRFRRLVVMVQHEVALRLRASPGSRAYGALSVLVQAAARVERGFRVGPRAFVPRPRVDSEVVRLEPHARPPVPVGDPARFRQVVLAAFNQRRKQLGNSLVRICPDPAGLLRGLGIDPTRRAETLALAEFAAIAAALR